MVIQLFFISCQLFFVYIDLQRNEIDGEMSVTAIKQAWIESICESKGQVKSFVKS